MSCAQRGILALILDAKSAPATTVPQVASALHRSGGAIDSSCHITFHWIGRTYARKTHLRLADLQRALPASNDPSCPAGFAHGVLTTLGPQILVAGPRKTLARCNRSPTRYERYSCVHGLGHAYVRLFAGQLRFALRECDKLGAQALDCAQGAFHDYWFSLHGVDGTTTPVARQTPQQVCAAQPDRYVRACWYRVFMEFPPKKEIRHAQDLERLCRSYKGLQHSACITAASVIASPDPVDQLLGCTRLRATDQVSCIRGVSVPSVMDKPLGVQLNLAEACSQFRATRVACFSWLGRTLAVVTNGRFTGPGCGALYASDRRACRAGARTSNGPLETFS